MFTSLISTYHIIINKFMKSCRKTLVLSAQVCCDKNIAGFALEFVKNFSLELLSIFLFVDLCNARAKKCMRTILWHFTLVTTLGTGHIRGCTSRKFLYIAYERPPTKTTIFLSMSSMRRKKNWLICSKQFWVFRNYSKTTFYSISFL